MDPYTWSFQLELEWVYMDGRGGEDSEPVTLRGSVIENRVLIQWVPKVKPSPPEPGFFDFIYDIFPWLRPTEEPDTYGQILDGTDIDAANHQAKIVFSLARNETTSWQNLLRTRLLWFRDRNGEIYQVDPNNPEQAVQTVDQVQFSTVPYWIEERNLYGYDRDLVMGLFYTNYALGFTHLLAAPLRAILTPVLLFYFFVPPFEMLSSQPENVYFTLDSFWHDVMSGWWATNAEVAFVYWFFDLLAYVPSLVLLGYSLGYSSLPLSEILGGVGVFYII